MKNKKKRLDQYRHYTLISSLQINVQINQYNMVIHQYKYQHITKNISQIKQLKEH